MASAFGRAREAGRGSGGSYLKTGDLIDEQVVMGIRRVKYDEGGGFNNEDRWLLEVFAWYDGETLPNEAEAGLLPLRCHPNRDGFMKAIQEEIKGSEEGFVGPCVLVKLKAGKYGRWLDLVEWDEQAERAVVPEANGRQEPEEDDEPAPPQRRPQRAASSAPSRAAAPAPRQAEPEPEEDDRPVARPAPVASPEGEQRRPFASAGEREEDEVSRDRPDMTGRGYNPNPSDGDLRAWAEANGFEVKPRGRLPRAISDAYHEARGGDYELDPQDGRLPVPPPVPSAPQQPRPASVPVPQRGTVPQQGGANQSAGRHAQEIQFEPGQEAVSVDPCPTCGERIRGRAFPAMDGGGLAIIHMCEGSPMVLAAEPIGEDE